MTLSSLLITGATGFIGSRLAQRLTDTGHKVHAVGRTFPHGALPNTIEKTISLDLRAGSECWMAALEGIANIVHLAAYVHRTEDRSIETSRRFADENFIATKRIADAAAKSGVQRFVFLSTVKIHGEGGQYPYAEESSAFPQNPYANSKWNAEKALLEIGSKSELEIVVLRPPLVYGPGVKANFLRLLRLVDVGIPLPLALINNRRSLVYVENLVDAICACIDHPNAAGKTFLVSDGEDLSTTDLIRRLAKAMGKPARLFPVPPALLSGAAKLPGGFSSISKMTGSLTVDSSKIRRELGWTPPYSVNEGIRETVRWYLKNASRSLDR